ncbi:hypothetical protein [Paraclostridium bifermentans]|uniref:hypothetical protein n=1 Tax=Paraclostridium bifermentans TaxID=1490 RepID=UPI00243296D7|nr:hypothetical protein [Paraclostridium bifermentans]
MQREDYENIYTTLDSMTSEYNGFKRVMIKILKQFKSKKVLKRLGIIIFICLLFSKAFEYVAVSNNTYKYINNLIDTTDTTMLALLGITFTGYALFQAMTSGYTLVVMLRERDDERSKFEDFNLSFFSLTLGYLLVISLNYILKLIIPILIDSKLFEQVDMLRQIKNPICIIFTFIYVVFNIYLLLEMRSFLFNIFQCFNINVISQGVKTLKDQNEKQKAQ